MADRVSAILITPHGRLLTLRQERPDGSVHHVLPGTDVDESGTGHEDALRRALHHRLKTDVTIGRLIHIARTGPQDEYAFVVRITTPNLPGTHDPKSAAPTRGAGQWEEIDLTPATINAADLKPKEIALLLAGHLRHGQAPWTLPDLRSRPPATRKHRKKR
ncbi:MAG: hydrolase [Actinomycetia bacterium]|nr:hydrolase [Actinomycetes bacterium]